MSGDIVRIEPAPEDVELAKRTVFPDSTDDEMRMFLYDCKRRGLHPLDKMLHPTVRTVDGKRKYTPITSIDYMRSRADATGDYAGNDDPVFDGEPGKDGFSATVTVWKIVRGQRVPFTAAARWKEYKPDKDFMWRKMPHTMLGKCAEALALRKGFPQELAGLYAREEMEQAGVIDVQPVRDVQPLGNGKQAEEPRVRLEPDPTTSPVSVTIEHDYGATEPKNPKLVGALEAIATMASEAEMELVRKQAVVQFGLDMWKSTLAEPWLVRCLETSSPVRTEELQTIAKAIYEKPENCPMLVQAAIKAAKARRK